MSETLTIKTESLEPLFTAWKEPLKHRVRADSGVGATDDAAYRYEAHLRLGYERWLESCEEWLASKQFVFFRK